MPNPGTGVIKSSGKAGILPNGKLALFNAQGKCDVCCETTPVICMCDDLPSTMFATMRYNNIVRPGQLFGHLWDSDSPLTKQPNGRWEGNPGPFNAPLSVSCGEQTDRLVFREQNSGTQDSLTDVGCCRPVALLLLTTLNNWVGFHELPCSQVPFWHSPWSCEPVPCNSLNPFWTGTFEISSTNIPTPQIPIAFAPDIDSVADYGDGEYLADVISDQFVVFNPPYDSASSTARVDLACNGSGYVELECLVSQGGATAVIRYRIDWPAGTWDLNQNSFDTGTISVPLVASQFSNPPATADVRIQATRGCP